MDSDEALICEFLKSCPGQFVSATEICRRAGGKWRYREDEKWAWPVLQRMLENKLVESAMTGHYRLVMQPSTGNEKKWWICPQLKKVLLESGRHFEGIDLREEAEAAAGVASEVG